MKTSLVAALFAAVLMILNMTVSAQCCGDPEDGMRYVDDIIDIGMDRIINEDIVLNGTVILENDLLVENSTLRISGKGIVVSNGASLTIINSTITTHNGSSGFYLDLLGETSVKDTLIEGCTDQENSFFGLYVEGSDLEMDNVTMTDSGMVRLTGGSASIQGSKISGIISYSGNITLNDVIVDRQGISQIGKGKAHIENVSVHSSVPFSSTAGIYAIGADVLSVVDTSVQGTFNGGISVISTPLTISNVSIDLPNGTISMEITDLRIDLLQDLTSYGTDYGMFIHNCTSEKELTEIFIGSSERGIDLSGNYALEITDMEIAGSSIGASIRAPVSIRDSSFRENDVGMIVEDGSIIELINCSFIDYRYWGIEDETWSENLWPDVDFMGAVGSKGTVAWWGYYTIEVTGPGSVDVEGSKLTITSPFGTQREVYGDQVDLIWGYSSEDGIFTDLQYSITARWGTAKKNISYVPQKGNAILVELPMTDLWIDGIEADGNTLRATVGTYGAGSNEVLITIFMDGKEWTTYRTTIQENDSRTIIMEDVGIPEGEHTINLTVSSQDEYRGGLGAYVDNNKASIEITDKVVEDENNEILLIALGCLILISILSFFVPILLGKRD